MACISATTCTALGSYTVEGIVVPLVLAYNGSTSSLQSTPALATTDGTSSLAGVACSSPGACTAVRTSAGGAFVLREAHGGWSIQPAPNPDAATAASVTSPGLSAVACPGARACLAVGNYQNGFGDSQTFGEPWKGGR